MATSLKDIMAKAKAAQAQAKAPSANTRFTATYTYNPANLEAIAGRILKAHPDLEFFEKPVVKGSLRKDRTASTLLALRQSQPISATITFYASGKIVSDGLNIEKLIPEPAKTARVRKPKAPAAPAPVPTP